MPWVYLDPDGGHGMATVTDDDSNEIGIVSRYDLNMALDGANASLEIIITDIEGWVNGFHRAFLDK